MTKEKQRERNLRKKGYRIVRLLGRGSFSEVYLVSNDREERFACKMSGNLKLLQREAEVLAQLAHPLFPEYGTFWQEEEGYLVMEYVAGCPLEDKIRQRGALSVESTVEIGRELAGGLGWLHRQTGLLYRDLKPANLMLCQNGRVKLVDFGCVCRAEERAEAKAGTPGFAAPEQMREGECLTVACDVYGLGRTLEALLGRAERGQKKIRRVIAACTRFDVQERLPDMRSVLAALDGCGRRQGDQKTYGGWERDILQGNIKVEKNIWKSSYKMT